MINDPLGDMLTRIRNAQMRRRGTVSTPGSKLRARVLEVLKSEGYIRDFSQTEFGNGRTEFSIELKYYDGQPVIRSIERVSKPGRRVYACRHHAARGRRSRHHHSLDAAGRDGRSRGPGEERGRRSALQGLLRPGTRTEPRRFKTRVGKKPVPVPSGVTATVDGQMEEEGHEGRTFVPRSRRSVGCSGGRRRVGEPARRIQDGPPSGACPALRWRTWSKASKGFEKRLEINGVGYKAAVAGKVLKLSLGYSHDIDYAIPAGITITTPKPTGRRRRHRQAGRSVRPPPRSANTAVRSPTRARA